MPTLLLIAHGSRDPRHAATVAALVEQVRAQRPPPTWTTAPRGSPRWSAGWRTRWPSRCC